MESDSKAHSVDTRTGKRIIEENEGSLANPTYSDAPVTDFENIGPSTDLESLNLNWREKDLPERERTRDVHRLHPYLGKFIPQLVEIFLRKFEPRCVIDPFVGSGTTCVEASRLGVNSFGMDISPFNCLLTKVKSDIYDLGKLEREVGDCLRRSAVDQLSLFCKSGRTRTLEPTQYISEWFAPQAQEELLAYCSLIPEYEYADVLKIILSRSARSARLVPHHELDRPTSPQREPYECRKHKRICTPVQEARKFLKRYSKDTVRRIKQFARLRKPACAAVAWGDSRTAPFPPADLIVTSPPYVGLIDYHEQHRYAYELMSLLPEPFASIGHTDQCNLRHDEAEIGPASNGVSMEAQAAYAEGIENALANASRLMTRGGHLIVVVNDKHNVYDQVREALPVEEVCVLNRHVNRRTGRRSSPFYEQVLIWRKIG